MTTVDHYKPNLRDIFFQLFEVLGIQSSILGKAPFASMDEDTARASLEGFLEEMQKTWAPVFASGDREGTHFDPKTGNVTLPKGFNEALTSLYKGGWNKLDLPEHMGGYGAPPTVQWAAFELMSGANPAICLGFVNHHPDAAEDRAAVGHALHELLNRGGIHGRAFPELLD